MTITFSRKKKKAAEKKEYSKVLDSGVFIMAIVCTFIHVGLTVFAGFREYSDIELSSFANIVLVIWTAYTTMHSFYLNKSKAENLNKYKDSEERGGNNGRGN